MKIIITEHQFKTLLESTDGSHPVDHLLELENIKINFVHHNGSVIDDENLEYYFGTDVIDDNEIEDTLGGGDKIYLHSVAVKFYVNDILKTTKIIYFITKNNKVIGIHMHEKFPDIATSFRYIPYDDLMSYFIQKGKRYLENVLKNNNSI